MQPPSSACRANDRDRSDDLFRVWACALIAALVITRSDAELSSIRQDLIAKGVKYCVGAYVDLLGVPKGKVVPVGHFDDFARGSELYTGYALDGLGQSPNDDEIASVVERLANVGKRVIVAGLDLDYLGEPFDHVTRLLAQAEEITKALAICVRCGNPASRTQRLVPSEERIVVGGSRAYEARCRQCFEPRLAQAELPLEERARSRKAGQ